MGRYGRWETGESVGEGGQGHLFFATDTKGINPGRFVLKRLKNINRKELFEREIRAIAQLQHPNILGLVDYDLSGDTPFYVAEHCERGSLAKIGGAEFKGNIEKTVSILVPIAHALSQAHSANIIHRDIKPENILLRLDGTPVLADFGICHMEGGERITLTDQAMGSRDYIAPEMESGRRFGPPTSKTDVYSLGKVLYWMLSGGRIFARENHRDRPLTEILGDQIFEHADLLLDRVVVERPDDRATIDRLGSDLSRLRLLVENRYAPLKPSIGIQCRFCGLGRYAVHKASPNDYLGIQPQNLGRSTQPISVNAILCDNCGHVELFSTGTSAVWWQK
jgi:serine/threonine protein kinase